MWCEIWVGFVVCVFNLFCLFFFPISGLQNFEGWWWDGWEKREESRGGERNFRGGGSGETVKMDACPTLGVDVVYRGRFWRFPLVAWGVIQLWEVPGKEGENWEGKSVFGSGRGGFGGGLVVSIQSGARCWNMLPVSFPSCISVSLYVEMLGVHAVVKFFQIINASG